MSVIDYNSPTLAVPRISVAKFKALLDSRNSPATAEAYSVFEILEMNGVDPSFALAQFRVESQYGTAGHAIVTGSWGNMLFDSSLTLLSGPTYSPGNGYTYATYENYVDAIIDYCRYIHWYITRYGLTTIYGATARWIGKVPGSSGHISYVNTIIDDMREYEFVRDQFVEAGDKMIFGDGGFDRATGKLSFKYPIVRGQQLYVGTDGTVLKQYQGTPGYAWYLGQVQGAPQWAVVCIGTSSADPNATWCYIKNPDLSKVIKV